nr:hypothetical protein [Halapricum sp. CBA1109]
MCPSRRSMLATLGWGSVAALAGCGLLNRTEHEVATLFPRGDGDPTLGSSVALSDDGTTALVGAPRARNLADDPGGVAFVFERQVGNWQEETGLATTASGPDASLGESVDLSADGTTALVSVPGGGDTGAAIVFERTDGEWRQTPLESDGSDDARAVALSGDGTTAVVGTGDAVTVFGRTDGRWDQQVRLAAVDGDSDIGLAVSRDGRRAFVGGPSVVDETPGEDGGVAVFEGDDWGRTATISPGDATDGPFGAALAASDDGSTLLVGAGSADPESSTAGSAAVYADADSEWTRRDRVTDPESRAGFGAAVDLSGDGSRAAVAVPAATADAAAPFGPVVPSNATASRGVGGRNCARWTRTATGGSGRPSPSTATGRRRWSGPRPTATSTGRSRGPSTSSSSGAALDSRVTPCLTRLILVTHIDSGTMTVGDRFTPGRR